MLEYLPLILSVGALLSTAIVTVWLKFLVGRVFKDMDGRIKGAVSSVNSKVDKNEFEVSKNDVKTAIENFEKQLIGKLDDLKSDIVELSASSKGHDIEITRLQEISKSVNKLLSDYEGISNLKAEFLEKFVRESQFIREVQSITSQIETIYSKINAVDNKINKEK